MRKLLLPLLCSLALLCSLSQAQTDLNSHNAAVLQQRQNMAHPAAMQAPVAAARNRGALKAGVNPCGGTVPHCNIIGWTAPTQPTGVVVSGWNVYKAATPNGYTLGSPFASVADPTILLFQDSTVAAGQTNYYALTAVCKTCTPAANQESAFSTALVLTTPTGQPNAPSITGQSF